MVALKPALKPYSPLGSVSLIRKTVTFSEKQNEPIHFRLTDTEWQAQFGKNYISRYKPRRAVSQLQSRHQPTKPASTFERQMLRLQLAAPVHPWPDTLLDVAGAHPMPLAYQPGEESTAHMFLAPSTGQSIEPGTKGVIMLGECSHAVDMAVEAVKEDIRSKLAAASLTMQSLTAIVQQRPRVPSLSAMRTGHRPSPRRDQPYLSRRTDESRRRAIAMRRL
ncbi:hypothetical protein J8273_1652 [Carpediemonas membranifera]|uniref:Uncharacterized protein n=1 Tax=Carpediemonas membranifera TaxID=201153 RepID=A0A8J6B0F0_9EUKA|nr:hypothetical protein J8273_1652 [Carpediemonas membranifera]|eukprot:KAG9396635.1 hypothetical protein J8273_1652 [Carpediemonas membranifera]